MNPLEASVVPPLGSTGTPEAVFLWSCSGTDGYEENASDTVASTCNTRTEEQKDVPHARNLAHRFADSAEAGNILKPNTTNPAMIAFKLESLWRKSSQKTGFAPISNAQFAQNHISPTAKTAEDAMMPSNKPEDTNPLPINPSLLRIPSNNVLDPPTQSSPPDTKPSLKGPTTLDTHAPDDHTHSKTSNLMPQPDPPINNHAINLLYE